MDLLFEIGLELAAKGSRRTAETLYQQLKAAIIEGRLKPGARLPATRQAESCFGVSRNTAAEIYDRLLLDGYLVSRQGAGTFVADSVPAAQPVSPIGVPAPERRLNPFWLRPDITASMGFWQDAPRDSGPTARGLDFRPALIDSRLFPFETFRKATAKQLRSLETRPASFRSAQGNQGNHALREAVTRHIALTRGVACRAEDVVVTSGAQQGFDLLARILVTPGETMVAVEDPGYPPMRVAFAAAGARIVPVGVDGEGLIVEQLPPDAGIICVCPSHQFPLGVSMSPRRRQALLDFARRHGAVIVEDDYDGEFRYEGSPLEALRTARNGDVVFYVGTFSKCMLPALRLGFIVAPGWALGTLVAAKNCLDWHCATPLQLGVAEFIAGGHLARHVRKMRQFYRKRRATLLEGLRHGLAPWLQPIPSSYGMHVAALATPGVDLEAAVARLGQEGVKLHTLRRYYLGAEPANGLVFGYGAVDPAEIARGLASLRQVLADRVHQRRL